MSDKVTLIIPTLSERADLLRRAVASATAQTRHFDEVIIEEAGPEDDAAHTRQRALDRVETPWVTFLDDDDELEMEHLETLLTAQEESNADVVYSYFTPFENDQPIPEDSRTLQLTVNGTTKSAFDLPWSRAHVDQVLAGSWCFHLTALFRTKMLRDIGGFHAPHRGERDQYLSEDLDLEQRLIQAGAKIVHAPKRTWRWYLWSGRTKGQPGQRHTT